jgi:glycosyltransferase involved in cell wall biosynthesis
LSTSAMSPRFSVIIPVYNRRSLIAETISSVQAQTFTDWECIVVDDGSTDGTAEVVRAIVDRDPRVRYVHQENAERSAARNNGIRNASGTYVCFLDSDDRYLPIYLDVLNEFLTSAGDPRSLTVSNFFVWDGLKTKEVAVPVLKGNKCEWLFTNPVSPSRTCVHRDVLREFNFREDIVMVEDSVLWCSIATKYPVMQLESPLVLYRVHDGNSVNRATTAAFKRHHGLLLFFKTPLSKDVSSKLRLHLLSDVRFRMAEYHAHEGKRLKAVVTLLWSMVTAPFHRHTKAKIFFLLKLIPGFESLWNSFTRPRHSKASQVTLK